MGHKMPKDKMYQDGKKEKKIEKLEEKIQKNVIKAAGGNKRAEKRAYKLHDKQSKAAGLSQAKKKTSYDENITKTMAQGRSGLYMDRDENGKLPADRVRLHYDRMDQMREAKMEQLGTVGNAIDQVVAGFKYGGKQFAKEAGDIYDSFKKGTKTALDAASTGAKNVAKGAKDFVKSFDDRAQPTSSIKKRNSIFYQDKK